MGSSVPYAASPRISFTSAFPRMRAERSASASGNTLAEALRAARIFGQALAVFLRGQIQAKAS